MEKIKVIDVKVKKTTDKYTIVEVTTLDGKKYDSFDSFTVGEECEVEVTANANALYNSNIKKPKAQGKAGFAPKNYDFDRKRVALECAVSMVVSGKITFEQLNQTRDKFHEFLK